jgi:hypothetical protein
MTNYALSLKFNLKPYYFGSMECNNKEKYDFIMSFDDYKIKSLNLYIQFVKNTIFKMENILDFYTNKEWLYGKILFDNKISNFGARKQVYLEDCKSIYQYRETTNEYLSISYSVILRWKLIIDLLYRKLFLKKLFLFTYRIKRN